MWKLSKRNNKTAHNNALTNQVGHVNQTQIDNNSLATYCSRFANGFYAKKFNFKIEQEHKCLVVVVGCHAISKFVAFDHFRQYFSYFIQRSALFKLHISIEMMIFNTWFLVCAGTIILWEKRWSESSWQRRNLAFQHSLPNILKFCVLIVLPELFFQLKEFLVGCHCFCCFCVYYFA